MNTDGLREHLVASRLAGEVATSCGNTLDNCRKLVCGYPEYTFGLSDWRTATIDEVLGAVRALCGGDPAARGRDGPGWIEPNATLAAIERHRERLATLVSSGGGRVLLATGHPTGLQPHYAALGRALRDRGCLILTPLDETWLATDDSGRDLGMRFLDGVGCVSDGGSLRHTHGSEFMEAMLDVVGVCDLVIGDHGMAGAAIERGLPTLSIADVNDVALPLAQHRGRTDTVLPIDDNLSPRLFTRITDAMLDWS
jgi:hypothetical protein